VSFQDHFSTKAKVYAQARPRYPAALFAHLAALAPGRALAWDCGSGNGQAAVALADHFDRVVASEPSAAQLTEATAHPRVTYFKSAETAPFLADRSVDLVAAAQAAHWFDLKLFYPEVRRVLRPGGIVALWQYAVCSISPEVDPVLMHFYLHTVGPYWPPERRHMDTAYRELEFPFPELPLPMLELEMMCTVQEFLVYLHTWSAVTRYTQDRGVDPVAALAPDLSRVWGEERRRVAWPLGGRLGRFAGA